MASKKTNRDRNGRYRSVTVAFRVSPQESEEINRLVQMSGMTKQGYIRDRLRNKEMTFLPSPRIYKGLKVLLTDILEVLRKIEATCEVPDKEILETINLLAKAANDIKGDKIYINR